MGKIKSPESRIKEKMKKQLLELIKNEVINNKLFKTIFLECLEIYPDIRQKEKLENKFYNYISILENYDCYINYSYLVIDINNLIIKRFNDILSLENVLKCLDILAIKE